MGLLKPIKRRLNGKLNIVDFRYLRPEDFKPAYNFSKSELVKETALCSTDGRLYINARMDNADFLCDLFEILMTEKRYALEQFHSMTKRKYPGITLDNVGSFEGTDQEIKEVFAGLLVPVEFLRRDLEKQYYSKVKPFGK